MERYAGLESIIVRDRNGKEIFIDTNDRGFYARYIPTTPKNVYAAFMRNEDRFFYYHTGVNPFSVIRSVISGNAGKGSSTITQQLVKVLLGQEQSRTLKNKLHELVYVLALELHTPKSEILTMYINAAYFGNRAQGIQEASRHYFGKDPADLTDTELSELIKTLRSPGVYIPKFAMQDPPERQDASAFELKDLDISCVASCALAIDANLSNAVRSVLQRNILSPQLKGAQNGAVVVIKIPENEILALIGSPDPSQNSDGYKINMARRPRQIGSTVKPLIYGRAFEKGLRPYTLVDDREYRYSIGTGFALYPKNYDYQYRGEVSLHYALANSLNVPTVKTLEYIGTSDFYEFLTDFLGFKPLQDLTDYELGIALGGLDMDLLTLAHYFTIFGNKGVLNPLMLKYDADAFVPPMETGDTPSDEAPKKVLPEPYIELVNKILTDRITGVEQFGIKSTLNLPYDNYGVKTGTSREFHDSWTIGYTPDFLVAVWVGNADDTPMDQVSGSIGAGRIWHDVMELLYASSYNKKTPFSFTHIKEFPDTAGIEYGLEGDDYERMKNTLQAFDSALILSPHDHDVILLQGAQIPLRAKEPVRWYINGNAFSEDIENEITFHPTMAGVYAVKAITSSAKEEAITIEVVNYDD